VKHLHHQSKHQIGTPVVNGRPSPHSLPLLGHCYISHHCHLPRLTQANCFCCYICWVKTFLGEDVKTQGGITFTIIARGAKCPGGRWKVPKIFSTISLLPKGQSPPKFFVPPIFLYPEKCVFNIKQKSFPPKNVFYPLTLKPGNGPATHGSCRTKQIKQF